MDDRVNRSESARSESAGSESARSESAGSESARSESAEQIGVTWQHVACALCGADEPRRILVDRVTLGGQSYDFPVVTCAKCGFVYVTPRGIGPVFGNTAGGGARHDARNVNQALYEHGLAGLESAGLPAGGRILDVGCARGDFLEFAAEGGFEVTGVDLNPKLAEVARQRGFDVYAGDLATLPLADDFDAVTLWDVIEHAHEPVALLEACRRVIRPGGLILCHTGNARFQIPKARLLSAVRSSGGPYLIPYQHVSHFDPASIRQAYRLAGFEPLDVFFAGTLHYRHRGKRLIMRTLNALGALPARAGGPLLTNAMAAIGRKAL